MDFSKGLDQATSETSYAGQNTRFQQGQVTGRTYWPKKIRELKVAWWDMKRNRVETTRVRD